MRSGPFRRAEGEDQSSELNESLTLVSVLVVALLFEPSSTRSFSCTLLQLRVLVCVVTLAADAGDGADQVAHQAVAAERAGLRSATLVAEGAVVLQVAGRRVGERERGNGEHAGRDGGHDDSSLLQHGDLLMKVRTDPEQIL